MERMGLGLRPETNRRLPVGSSSIVVVAGSNAVAVDIGRCLVGLRTCVHEMVLLRSDCFRLFSSASSIGRVPVDPETKDWTYWERD